MLSSYEPNRLGKAYLLDAYAKLVSIIRRPLTADKAALPNIKEDKSTSMSRSNVEWKK